MKKQKVLLRHRAAKTLARVVDWDKRLFDRAAKTVGSVQQRSEKAIEKAVEDTKWVPKEGKQLVAEWLHMAKRSRHELRKAIDSSLELTAGFLNRVGEPVAKKAAPPRKAGKRRAPARPAPHRVVPAS